MLRITVPGVEAFDEDSNTFVTLGDVELELEHSLASLSKWESEFGKAFLGKDEKTTEEVIAYVKAMTLTPDIPDDTYQKLSSENVEAINDYIGDTQTATRFNDPPGQTSRNRETITAELIYYWMVMFQIPFECQFWHLNRLFTLIRVCNLKQSKPKKMSKNEIATRQRELNAKRKAELGTRG